MDDEQLEFFEKSLHAEGVTDADVSVYRSRKMSADVIQVKSWFAGKTIGVEQTITDREYAQVGDIKQHLGVLASDTARKIEAYSTERHSWGENDVQFDFKGEKSVTCKRCGEEVSMDDLKIEAMPLAETAVPKPVTNDYSSLSKTKIQFTLLALLKEKCDSYCPNRKL